MDRCDECGFVYESVARGAIGDALRALPADYARAFEGRAHLATAHPLPRVWSALEYACHVRDVLRVQHDRLRLALAEDRPAFVPMGREERVIADAYNAQPLDAVLRELGVAAEDLAEALDGLGDAAWGRTGVYNYPTRAERDMTWLGRHTVHEGRHHHMDVERVLTAAAG